MKNPISWFFLLILSASFVLTEKNELAKPLLAPDTGAVTLRVSVSSDGTQANNDSADYALQQAAAISADGSVLAFESEASNLVMGDTNAAPDVFVHNLISGQTIRVSVSSSGDQGNKQSDDLDISPHGGVVAFRSYADNLVADDTNSYPDIFVHYPLEGSTHRVSISSSGIEGNFGSYNPFLADLGQLIAFHSGASNLVTPDTNSVYSDIFLYSGPGEIEIVSRSSDGTQGNRGSKSPQLTPDGSYVVFESTATNLIENDTNGDQYDIFVRDLIRGKTACASVSSSGNVGNDDSLDPSISDDGRYVVFSSLAANLVKEDTNGSRDIFLHDMLTKETRRVNTDIAEQEANSFASGPKISGNGRFVVFDSYASNLIPYDTNNVTDVFVKDLVFGSIYRVSESTNGDEANNSSKSLDISTDGCTILFSSKANNLVIGDTNARQDVFVRQLPCTDVHVQDESGSPSIGAQIYQNERLVGTTDEAGNIRLPDLKLYDRLSARYLVTEIPSQKEAHNQNGISNWMYRVYITSIDINESGEPQQLIVNNPENLQILTVKKTNTLLGYNIVASLEWDASDTYLADLMSAFRKASAYLYDASDGQVVFEWVTIYDNNLNMSNADFHFSASNQVWPHADGIPIVDGDRTLFQGNYVDLGRNFKGTNWLEPYGFKTFIHEFGHYGFGLWDSYFFYNSKFVQFSSNCTSPLIRTNSTPGINATIMDYQYNASEFAQRGVVGMWSIDCALTVQYDFLKVSDWETILALFADPNAPERYHLLSPLDHGGVVAGPIAQYHESWTTIWLGKNHRTGTCQEPKKIVVEGNFGTKLQGVSVDLILPDRIIHQGVTDENGEIELLGAHSTDQMIVWMPSPQSVYLGNVSCTEEPFFSPTIDDPQTVTLDPVAFPMEVIALPGESSNQVFLQVTVYTDLLSNPQLNIYQSGASEITISTTYYDANSQTYSAIINLDPSLPLEGIIVAQAQDTGGHSVTISSHFSLHSTSQLELTLISSEDGQTKWVLPPGTFAEDGLVTISIPNTFPPLPSNLLPVSGPYELIGSSGLSFMDSTGLTFYFVDTAEFGEKCYLNSAAIYGWDGNLWTALPETQLSLDDHFASAEVESFGLYALLAELKNEIYLPVVIR